MRKGTDPGEERRGTKVEKEKPKQCYLVSGQSIVAPKTKEKGYATRVEIWVTMLPRVPRTPPAGAIVTRIGGN